MGRVRNCLSDPLGTGAAGIYLDLPAGKMYLSYPNLHTITRRNLDGTNVETVLALDSTERPFGMELFAGRMYWCDNDNGLMRSATIGGTDVKTVLSGLDSPRAVSVSTFVAPVTGDYNGNGIVDAADYTIWRNTLGSTTDLRANGDNSGASAGKIDQADYAIWKTNFGNHAGRGALANGTGMPEPRSLWLLAVAGLAVVVRRRETILWRSQGLTTKLDLSVRLSRRGVFRTRAGWGWGSAADRTAGTSG
jgi:hypothetical protein